MEKDLEDAPDAPIDQKDDMALGCLPPSDPLRRAAHYITELPSVQVLLMTSVIISSATLAFDTPRLDEASQLAEALAVTNVLFTAVFLLEAILKSIAYGFYGYLHSGWNVLDFSVLLISLGALLSEVVPALAFLQSLRALR
ncbi:voltage-gated ca2+ alpha subunit, partial [Chrysochromulina tobinii]